MVVGSRRTMPQRHSHFTPEPVNMLGYMAKGREKVSNQQTQKCGEISWIIWVFTFKWKRKAEETGWSD